MTSKAQLDKIRALSDVTGMVLQREQAKLAALLDQERELVRAFLDLDRCPSAPEHGEVAPSERMGNTLAWQHWSDIQKQRINEQMALLRAEIELERSRVARAFGRQNVLDKLAAQHARPRSGRS